MMRKNYESVSVSGGKIFGVTIYIKIILAPASSLTANMGIFQNCFSVMLMILIVKATHRITALDLNLGR